MPFPTDEHWIAEAEAELGVRLPHAFRAALLLSNGGELEIEDEGWIVHPVFDQTDRKRISRSANHLVLENESARAWAGFPGDAIAIAEDGSGNRLVLLPDATRSGELRPEVFRWDHETDEVELACSEFPGF